jgi:DNA-binding MarR family transcriptional regulator
MLSSPRQSSRILSLDFPSDARLWYSLVRLTNFVKVENQTVPSPTTEPTIYTADRLHSAAIHLLRRLRRQDAASGLTAPRLSALSVVVYAGPLTLGALANAEGVRPPTMTRIVAALEEAGLVSRAPGPRDRREILVDATDEGRRLLAEGRDRRVQSFARQLAALPAAELATLEQAAEILDRLARE